MGEKIMGHMFVEEKRTLTGEKVFAIASKRISGYCHEFLTEGKTSSYFLILTSKRSLKNKLSSLQIGIYRKLFEGDQLTRRMF